MAIQLKRFNNAIVKVETHVPFEDSLQFAKTAYSLCSVIVHEGEALDNGHFIAYTRNGGRWHRVSDGNVAE